MKLVKNKKDDSFAYIVDESFVEALHIDYSSSVWHWINRGVQFLSKKELNIILKTFNFDSLRDEEKKMVALCGIGTITQIDSVLSKEDQVKLIANGYAPLLIDGSKESDGRNYFNNFRAELVYDYKHSIKTDAEIFMIESKLKDVTNNLIKGDWMSAFYMLNTISTDIHITADIKNRLLNDFSDYILNNY